MKLLVLGLAFACWHAAAQQRYPDPPWMVGPAPAVLAPTVSFPVRLVETPGLLPRFEIVDGVCVIYLSARNDAEVFLASPILDYCGSFRGLATRPVPGTLWVRWKQAASIVEVTRLFDETSPPRKVNPKRPFGCRDDRLGARPSHRCARAVAPLARRIPPGRPDLVALADPSGRCKLKYFRNAY
jgi:hypothetical protein